MISLYTSDMYCTCNLESTFTKSFAVLPFHTLFLISVRIIMVIIIISIRCDQRKLVYIHMYVHDGVVLHC